MKDIIFVPSDIAVMLKERGYEMPDDGTRPTYHEAINWIEPKDRHIDIWVRVVRGYKESKYYQGQIGNGFNVMGTAYFPTREMALDDTLRMALYYMKDDRYEN